MTLKRVFDFVISLLLIIALSPILLIIGCLIKISSKGPIIFKQKRLGYKGAPFTIFKFRTLMHDSEFPIRVIPGDSRITPLGSILRKTHLDELPQLWNVIRGEMSLVGPRPFIEELTEMLEKDAKNFRNRLHIKPGITGPVQIRGRLEVIEGGPNEALRLDIWYIENNNFLLDLKIIAMTLRAILKFQGI